MTAPNDGEKGKTPSMQRLMPDSKSPEAERRLQPRFSKASIFNYLALLILILAGDRWIGSIPNRSISPDALAAIRFTPAHFSAERFQPLRLVGAWKVEVADPRFGGISALAIDRGRLLALSDSGTVVTFPKPGEAGRAFVHDLPDGPGDPDFKRNRDSEALARDPAGRGWWVAFERWNQLWLYDSAFTKALMRVDLGRHRWRQNKGIEGMVADGGGLILFPETGSEWLEWRGGRTRVGRLANRSGRVSDAVRTSEGRLLAVMRQPGLEGLTKRLTVVERSRDGTLSLRSLARLGLGATDNIEAIAAEPRAGGTRLWLMTDNDFRARAPTYLVALNLP